MVAEDSIPDYKLCGYLCTVLKTTTYSVYPNSHKTLEFGTLCQPFTAGSEPGFTSVTGVTLTPITDSNHGDISTGNGNAEFGGSSSSATSSRNKNKNIKGTAAKNYQTTKKRRNKIGLVRGSMSVVHQIHALVSHKCLKVAARVVGVVPSDDGECGGEMRAVVLVDVYLPIELWSGWQFPKSSSAAAALFRHLRCDWVTRYSILSSSEGYCKYMNGNDMSVWDLAKCHVLGCKQHCKVTDSSKQKLFELHEIFKSLPSLAKDGKSISSRIRPNNNFSSELGIWDLSDDILVNILASLGPIDLVQVSGTCHHLRTLAASIMPCVKLKLFPHQQAAVEWMLQRERNSGIYSHPLYLEFLTEDGFAFYINNVSGEILTGMAPIVRDFRGGMICDEPGLGKTITALSLILKTQGTLAEPPDGAEVIWCTHNGDKKCGYYETGSQPGNRSVGQKERRRGFSIDELMPSVSSSCFTPKRTRLLDSDRQSEPLANPCPAKSNMKPQGVTNSTPATIVVRCSRSVSLAKKNLFHSYGSASGHGNEQKSTRCCSKSECSSSRMAGASIDKRVRKLHGLSCSKKRASKDYYICDETWVQCDACRKWRRLSNCSAQVSASAWFCSMNDDPLYQSCDISEEPWDYRQPITYLPGFCEKGTAGGLPQNVSFFAGVLKEHNALLDNSHTKKALLWLAKLSPEKLSEMETTGLVRPGLLSTNDANDFHKIFQAFGLEKKVEKGVSRWFYPQAIDNLVFDLAALRLALIEPLDSTRSYLSRATLIVVPPNLVDHWVTQIQKHVKPGQLQVLVWKGLNMPSAHNLAWDYDVVITTFTRLSVERNSNNSALKQVHWLRVVLDEGHTLSPGSNVTNKLRFLVSLTASNRWLLTGTPTPNTPNTQLSHLQPMLRFLHEEVYGQNQKSWEAGILKPFEAEMEEGWLRLLQLLNRCMVCARKVDLQCIPPCIKKTTYLDFTEQHAKTYNELVVTVRRNILMADWNDPSHVESLLNPKQWKFRATTIKNVRLSCCVAGHIKVAEAGHDVQETMDVLVENGLDSFSEEYAFIRYNLLYGGNCQRCQEWCRLPIITPCRHFLCLDCVALDSQKCALPGCGHLYEMQNPETLARPENPNPKWPVPKDLIELQPSYKQDNWDPDWQSTSSSKVTYLVQRLKEIQEANKRAVCIGKEVHSDVEGMDQFVSSAPGRQWHHFLPQRAYFSTNFGSCEAPPEKVLIFSQFLEHIHVMEQQLSFAGIKFVGMYSPMQTSHKMKSLGIFQQDAECMVLLMDGTGALGLDLSFVSHVFLMEPIWDRSMEEQVISRAHRMGATRPISVETLAMRDTIEEQMLKFLQVQILPSLSVCQYSIDTIIFVVIQVIKDVPLSMMHQYFVTLFLTQLVRGHWIAKCRFS